MSNVSSRFTTRLRLAERRPLGDGHDAGELALDGRAVGPAGGMLGSKRSVMSISSIVIGSTGLECCAMDGSALIPYLLSAYGISSGE